MDKPLLSHRDLHTLCVIFGFQSATNCILVFMSGVGVFFCSTMQSFQNGYLMLLKPTRQSLKIFFFYYLEKQSLNQSNRVFYFFNVANLITPAQCHNVFLLLSDPDFTFHLFSSGGRFIWQSVILCRLTSMQKTSWLIGSLGSTNWSLPAGLK